MRVLIALDTQLHDHPAPELAIDGELVSPIIVECEAPGCELCQTAWAGLVSHGRTFTAMVVDRPGVTEADLRARVHGWLDCLGVVDRVVQASEAGEYEVDGICCDDPVTAIDDLVSDHVHQIHEICAGFGVGTIVSRLGSLVAPRHVESAA